jgi:hypothetical protein
VSENGGAAASQAAGFRAEPAVAWAAILAVAVLVNLRPVPYEDELIYLLHPWRIAHPGFLAHDWTFA